MALNLTGQLTIGDANNIGNTGNYIRIRINDTQVSVGTPLSSTYAEALLISVAVYKSKASFNAGKPALQAYDAQVTNEIRSQYTIDATAIATSPQANFNALLGKSLRDKQLYWVHQQVLALIIADNPTFSGSIVDINL